MAHGTLLSVMQQAGQEGSLRENNTCVCMAESLCCSRETITTLLISHTQIQNKVKKNKNLSIIYPKFFC